MAAVVLPTSPWELARKQSPNPYDRVILTQVGNKLTMTKNLADATRLATNLICGCNAHVEHATALVGAAGAAVGRAAVATPAAAVGSLLVAVAAGEPPAQVHHAHGQVLVDVAHVRPDAAQVLRVLARGEKQSLRPRRRSRYLIPRETQLVTFRLDKKRGDFLTMVMEELSV